MDQDQLLTAQIEGMKRLVDADTGAILMRHPSLKSIPDLLSEGDAKSAQDSAPGCGEDLTICGARPNAAFH